MKDHQWIHEDLKNIADLAFKKIKLTANSKINPGAAKNFLLNVVSKIFSDFNNIFPQSSVPHLKVKMYIYNNMIIGISGTCKHTELAD